MSVDSDDQNFNKNDDTDDTLLVNGENMKYTYCDSIRKNQCADKNGNSEPAESLNNNNLHSGGVTSVGSENEDHENVKRGKRIDQKAISRLEAMAMSDDEDYGKNNSLFTCSQYRRYC